MIRLVDGMERMWVYDRRTRVLTVDTRGVLDNIAHAFDTLRTERTTRPTLNVLPGGEEISERTRPKLRLITEQ